MCLSNITSDQKDVTRMNLCKVSDLNVVQIVFNLRYNIILFEFVRMYI